MIPKKIHYCWFGKNPLPELALKCIESWRKFLPEYEVILWNENNFDINSNIYVAEAYSRKKYAFVSDYVRLYALMQFGGIYMDTDVEVIGGLDKFLFEEAFSGFESNGFVPTGLMASKKGGRWICDLLRHYENRHFILQDGTMDITTNTEIITEYMIKIGLQKNNRYQKFFELVTLYPSDYFCPFSPGTGKLKLTENTRCIHHFAASWQPTHFKLLTGIKRKLINLFGAKLIDRTVKILGLGEIKRRVISRQQQ